MKEDSPRENPLKVLSGQAQECHEQEGTTAYPLAVAAGLWAERFGTDLLLSHRPETPPTPFAESIRRLARENGWRAQRVFARRLVARASDQRAPVCLEHHPDANPGAFGEAAEFGLRYGLDFSAYTVGLFLDQAANRRRVYDQTRPGQRLLNLFAYTCSFSVVAAARGADTLSVDLAKPALTRGRDNLERNGLMTSPASTPRRHRRHRFLADDAFAVLPRLARRGERFDWIILDPPTFSHGKRDSKKKLFRVEDDLPELIARCWDVLAPGGRLLVSTNATTLTHKTLECMIHTSLGKKPADYQLAPAPTTTGTVSAPGPTTAWWVEREA